LFGKFWALTTWHRLDPKYIWALEGLAASPRKVNVTIVLFWNDPLRGDEATKIGAGRCVVVAVDVELVEVVV